jgi:hypothetical protein
VNGVARSFVVTGSGMRECVFDVPAEAARAETTIDLSVREGSITTYHYWFE